MLGLSLVGDLPTAHAVDYCLSLLRSLRRCSDSHLFHAPAELAAAFGFPPLSRTSKRGVSRKWEEFRQGMAYDRSEISGAAHHRARRAARSKTATQAPFYKIFPFIINQLERQNGNAVAVSPHAPGLAWRFEDARSQSALSPCGGAHRALRDTMGSRKRVFRKTPNGSTNPEPTPSRSRHGNAEGGPAKLSSLASRRDARTSL
jgi:hypothetical protein